MALRLTTAVVVVAAPEVRVASEKTAAPLGQPAIMAAEAAAAPEEVCPQVVLIVPALLAAPAEQVRTALVEARFLAALAQTAAAEVEALNSLLKQAALAARALNGTRLMALAAEAAAALTLALAILEVCTAAEAAARARTLLLPAQATKE